MKLEQDIFKKYITESKTKSEICKELGLDENDLKAWIRFYGMQKHKSLSIVRKQWEGFIPKSLLRNGLQI